MDTPEWELSRPHRPLWEPVHLTDWQGERLKRLRALHAELTAIDVATLDDDQLATRAIIDWLIQRGTVTIGVAKDEAARLATQRIPKRPGHVTRLNAHERSDVYVAVGRMWERVTSSDFPPPPPEPSET